MVDCSLVRAGKGDTCNVYNNQLSSIISVLQIRRGIRDNLGIPVINQISP